MLISTWCKLQRLECPSNHFILDHMESCHPWLTCKDLNKITIKNPLGKGAVKDVFLAKWGKNNVVLSLPASSDYIEDFKIGVETLMILNPSKYVVQFVGHCDKENALFTEYHPLGNALEFFNKSVIKNLTEIQSLGFCLQYSLILSFLHNQPNGPRVFCDSNDLHKLLSQLLVTSQSTLILNDVDALPVVINSSGIKCGHRQLEGTFVAPEQLWNKEGQFTDSLLPGYNEKTDIWKAASVCEFFLTQAAGKDVLRYRLFNLHSRCKNNNPELRPSAGDLVNEYRLVIEDYNSHVEL